jgi:ribonuclease HI
MTNQAIIFTDGACLGNPGPGGYAAVITIAGDEQIIVGRDRSTTNNKMEMTAAIKALEAVSKDLPIVTHSVRIRAGPPCGIEAFGRALAISTSIWTVL